MTLNRNYGLNIKLWASVIGLGLFGIAAGGGTALNTLERVENARRNAIGESNAVAHEQRQARLKDAEIESRADIQQSYIDNKVNLFDSLHLPDYTCDPSNPPVYEWPLYAQPDQKVNVSDRNQRVIGEITPTGNFYFFRENCN